MIKKINLLIVCFGFAFSSFSQISQATLQASGLTCAMCAKSVYKNLESLPFVDRIDIDLNASSFLIIFKSASSIDIDALSKKVQDAGFSVASLKLTIKFDGAFVKNDAHLNIENKIFHFVNVKSQTLNGNIDVKLVDPSFVSLKDSKKYLSMTKMACMKSGKSESCCISAGIKSDSRIFHITI